jgi:acyl-CoA thioester hydrolase
MAADNPSFVETYRGVVAPWECDVMGHLTIAFYFDRFADAAFALVDQLAPAAAPPAAVWQSTAILARFQQELRAGDGLFIRSGVIDRVEDGIRVGHELVNAGTGEIATLIEHTLAPRDLPYGALAEQRRVLGEAITAWVSPSFADAVPAIRTERMINTCRDRVKAWEVDERGELSLSGVVHRFAHACLHLFAAIGATPVYMQRERRGFSTFEMRLLVDAALPGAGDGIAVRSGLVAVGNSSLRMLHELYLARNGDPIAHCYQSGVHFDLEARRSAPMPAAWRETATALLIV